MVSSFRIRACRLSRRHYVGVSYGFLMDRVSREVTQSRVRPSVRPFGQSIV